MTRKNRPVADRLKSLQPRPPAANFWLSAIKDTYTNTGYQEYHCTINEYCRTRIFEFPRIDFNPTGKELHHIIYSSLEVQAAVVSNLIDYFVTRTSTNHYSISPSLQYKVKETYENIKSQQKHHTPVFLVIEELNQLTPVNMNNGECSIYDEVAVRNGEKVPVLIGGREGEKFLMAWATVDGAWPELPSNQLLVNMILAGIRAGQETPNPICKYLDQEGLVTDDGRFVEMMRPTMSARGETTTPMDSVAFRARASQIRTAIAAMEQDIGGVSGSHFALLFNSLYRDEYMDDGYQRLHYLQLWQALQDAGRKCLNYQGNVKYDHKIIAGSKTLLELTEYRDDVAHWWTDSIDENYLSDLQQSINELIRRKYF